MITEIKKHGLSGQEVEKRLRKYGLNQFHEEQSHPWTRFLSKFWGPIPWMLELTMALQFALGKRLDGSLIVMMLIVNALIGYFYERKAQNSLALLRLQLEIKVRVMRDKTWIVIPSQELVPGDLVRLRVGDIVPADARIIAGQIAVDQSSLTGESILVELNIKDHVYAASLIRRGEAIVKITATGKQTSYGKTAQLVQVASPTDHGDIFVQRIVLYLMAFTVMLVMIVVLDAWRVHLSLTETLLFTLALLIAAIPVSLPVTFTLATAVGARELAQRGVLVTRLGAVKEAATMDVLCSDKTGTITTNELRVAEAQPYNAFSRSKLLRLAELASDEATHDPIDLAIMHAAHHAKPRYGKARRLEFTGFDPLTKRTEALVDPGIKGKKKLHIIKGSPHIISDLTRDKIDVTPDVERFAASGNRCIAIATGKKGKSLKLAGLLALQDPPREDAAAAVNRLHELGVRVIMITGDDLATARNIAEQIGITGQACTIEAMQDNFNSVTESFDVFARVYPEDKFKIVQEFQKTGHIVGMAGDGINDAPAIRQAEIGVAVSNATDITKSAASFVLTAPGLTDMLAAVEVGRSIFQRISTYTLNKSIKTFHLGAFLSLGLLLTGTLVVQPIHVLLLVLANDLVSMSLTTDHVHPSPKPDQWRSFPLIASGLCFALAWIGFSFIIYFFGRDRLRLNSESLQTLTFLMLVCVAQANIYLIRERDHFWRSCPSRWMLLATALDLVIISILVLKGILVSSLSLQVILQVFAATVTFMFVLDFLKTRVFRYFDMRQ